MSNTHLAMSFNVHIIKSCDGDDEFKHSSHANISSHFWLHAYMVLSWRAMFISQAFLGYQHAASMTCKISLVNPLLGALVLFLWQWILLFKPFWLYICNFHGVVIGVFQYSLIFCVSMFASLITSMLQKIIAQAPILQDFYSPSFAMPYLSYWHQPKGNWTTHWLEVGAFKLRSDEAYMCFLVVVSNVFYFHPYLGKIPILTNIFQMG